MAGRGCGARRARYDGRLAVQGALRRALCLLLALGVALGLAGCGVLPQPGPDSQTAGTPAAPETDTPAPDAGDDTLASYPLVLPWYRTQGYNPYLTNNQLTWLVSDLLFEKLVVLNPAGDLEWRVVYAADVQSTAVTLYVADGYRFADGSPVTAADVAASLLAARQSALYRGRFAHVTNVRAGEDTVTVTLDAPDIYFAWLLDIPVMPAGETAAAMPRASGRYTYAAEGAALIPNPQSDAAAPFDTVQLWEMTDAEALAGSLNIGAISLYASEAEALENGINASRQAGYYTNTLVYLGFNAMAWRQWRTYDAEGNIIWHTEPTGSAPLLAEAAGRRAVEQFVDRTALLERVYYNRGHVASGWCNTVGAVGGAGLLTAEADPAAGQQALAALGYTLGPDGYYHAPAGQTTPADPLSETDRLTLRLLVYAGSSYKRYLGQLVADALEAGGIGVSLELCDDLTVYRQRIAGLDFDMYIGEIKLYNNMDMNAFFGDEGAAAAGIVPSEQLLQTYADWRAGTTDAAALEAALAAEMPFAPILWRSGTLYYDKVLDGFSPSASSPFYGLENVILAQ